MLHYTPNASYSRISFKDILDNANKWIKTISSNKQTALKEKLKHGSANITSKELLKMYLHSYGEIHQLKLIQAFEHIPHNVWLEDGISVVDYGCGQGIAEMVLSDFIKSKFIEQDYIKEFILIEPSNISLMQAVKNVKQFFLNTHISAICKSDKDLSIDDVIYKSNTVFHILSNVIDLPDFNGKQVLNILNNGQSHNNIVICVSPFYQENCRGKWMEDFGKQLKGYRLHYRFEKHIDEWEKSYSCQIHIYVSSYY